MTPDEFRSLALDLPESSEDAHQNHPDFRVRGRVFATLGPNGDWGMVKLAPDEQSLLVVAEPDVFEPFSGAWGRRGCTRVVLDAAHEASVRRALLAAWRNTAPKLLVQRYDRENP